MPLPRAASDRGRDGNAQHRRGWHRAQWGLGDQGSSGEVKERGEGIGESSRGTRGTRGTGPERQARGRGGRKGPSRFVDALEDPWVGRCGWAELAWVPGPPQAEDRIPQILPKMHTARPPTCRACGSAEADPSGIDGLEHLRAGAGEGGGRQMDRQPPTRTGVWAGHLTCSDSQWSLHCVAKWGIPGTEGSPFLQAQQPPLHRPETQGGQSAGAQGQCRREEPSPQRTHSAP